MAFIILLQTLDKNCGNLSVLIIGFYLFSCKKKKRKKKTLASKSTLHIVNLFSKNIVNQCKINNNNIVHQVPFRMQWVPTMKYPSPPSSGTICVSFETGRLVPELGGLGYQSGWFEKSNSKLQSHHKSSALWESYVQ